jgi:anaerobic dimethyl sulfoxide reductase subunit A
VKASIPVFLWTEAVMRGKSMTKADGIRGVEQLDNDIKLIYAVATNCLINQHADVNRTAEILRDESKVEFLAVQDNFITPTARFADIVLPACTQFETWGVEDGWKYGDEVILQPKLVEPLGQSKSDYQICAELAERLGCKDAFTQERDEKGWAEYCWNEFRRLRFPELPTFEEFLEKNLGAWTRPALKPAIAFEDFRRDPQKNPLNTPSGKIEIFSKQLFDLHNPEEIPPIPKYIQEWESPFVIEPGRHRLRKRAENLKLGDSVTPWLKEFPLQAIGHHTLHRVHSTHDNNDWLEEAFPQRVFINPIDANARGIKDGEEVKVYNSRGALILPCRVTPRIMPGVVDIPQGAWYEPDEKGVDRGGCVNVLTSHRWTPFAFGTTQHTIMVEVEKTIDDGHWTISRRRGSK